MGTSKLCLPWRGKTLIEHTIDAWLQGGVERVLVVVRADDRALAALVEQSGATLVAADPPPPDMKASVQAGLSYLVRHENPRDDDIWLTAPADLPSLCGEVIRRLLAAYDQAAPRTLVAGYQGRAGHPILFPWRRAAEVAELAADEGLKRLVERGAAAIIECGASAVAADVDTPEEYALWQSIECKDVNKTLDKR